MAPEVGLEPTTKRLTAARSTTELLGSAMAAEPGFEPGLEDSKSPVLPLHNSALCRRSDSNRHGGRPPTVFETVASTCSATSAYLSNWSGRRDSNSRPSPWQGDALPLSHFRSLTWCRGPDSNWGHLDFQSSALPTELPRRLSYSSRYPY